MARHRRSSPTRRQNYGYGSAEAERFIRALARRLDVTDEHVAGRITKTPGTTCGASAGCRPTSIRSTPTGRRARARPAAARSSPRGSRRSVGYALPLDTRHRRRRAWRTGPWFLRAERLYLMPGDSAMGYRLPLDSLPWVSALEYPVSCRVRSDGAATAAAVSGHAPRAGSTARGSTAAAGRLDVTVRSAASRAPGLEAPAPRRATPRRVGSRRRPHGAVHRGARRLPVRVHAAARIARALSRAGGGDRSHRRIVRCPGGARGLSAAGAIRGCDTSRSRPTPASSRSTSSRPQLGRARRSDDRRSTRTHTQSRLTTGEVHDRRPAHRHRRRQPLRARRSHRRPTVRSCAGPICSAASSPTGTTIRRCRTSSRDCSSARPARRRASTKRGTTACTSWRSRSRSSRTARPCRRPGWWIACSAIC